MIDCIPPLPGSYALHFCLPSPAVVAAGRLGIFSFPAGDYTYFGSARGPGGLKARLAHHFKRAAHPYWHMDYLRPFATVINVFYVLEHTGQVFTASNVPVECLWSRLLAGLVGTNVPAAGFGASDCRCGCPAHLLMIPSHMTVADVLEMLNVQGEFEGHHVSCRDKGRNIEYNGDTLRMEEVV